MMESGSVIGALMSIKGDATGIPFDENRDRFNMPHCADTRINEMLNANRIVVDGNDIAIATQYPFPHQLEAQLQMLLDNRTPVLVILASSTDIQNNQLPQYFSGSGTYGEIQAHSKFVDYLDLSNAIEAKEFSLTVSKGQASINIPVLHVYNWPDHRTVSPETTRELVTLIESKISGSRALLEQDSSLLDEAGLPVIHCKAGVGRTGQTLAALVMNKYPALTLESITKDLRASRNNLMIQTPHQMKTLLKLENREREQPQPEQPKTKSWRSIFRKAKG